MRCHLATVVALVPLVAVAFAQTQSFELKAKGASEARIGYFPVKLDINTKKPDGIKAEPEYLSTPKYAVITLGNGPKSKFIVALDEPKDKDFKIYIDKNQNGDLTDDGDGAWNKKNTNNDRTLYGVMDVTLRASYGTETQETSSADYTIGVYRFADLPALLVFRQSARAGSVTIDGKTHKALLVENDANGLYRKPAKNIKDAAKNNPVWLLVDTVDDGKYASGPIDVRAPFRLLDKAYEAEISDDGASVDVKPTRKKIVELTPKAPPRPELLKKGTKAPGFTAEKWGGGDLKLSDYKGKIVVIDFWATWCGPCKQSMPHVESVHKAVKDQNVVVIGVCVWDTKKAYEAWVPENSSKYTFQFAYDKAGRGEDSIAGKLFKVSGIPTTYVIDTNGKVADAIVGYSEGDKSLEEALKKLGVKFE